jgi:hypothetical protein
MDILKGASYHRDPIEAVIYRVLVIVTCHPVILHTRSDSTSRHSEREAPGHSRK